MTNNTKIKRKRDPLSPKPILDKKLLLDALESKGIYLTDLQLATFYQLLHRQNYPPLKSFVEQYYQNDNNTTKTDGSTRVSNENDKCSNSNVVLTSKNPISNKKKNLGRHLPKAFLEFLADADDKNDFVTITSRIESKPTSLDGTTTKMAIELQDGHVVESVLMRHISENGSRATVCVSSQVGCAMGCTFCATGTMGIRGNLCTGEILEQLVHAGSILSCEALDLRKRDSMILTADGSKKKKCDTNLSFVRNVVFMGKL